MSIRQQKYHFIAFIICYFAINIFLLRPVTLFAQDAVFSQYYANPVYLNPAYAGTHLCTRAFTNYRNQWPKFASNYVTYSLMIDSYAEKVRGGIAFMAVSDRLGGDVLVTNRYSLVYSYQMKINYETRLNAGFEATFHQHSFNTGDLIFRDMIDPVTGQVNQGISVENYLGSNADSKADFSFGLLLFFKEKYQLGISSHHLSQPDIDYFGTGEFHLLRRRYTVHATAAFTLVQHQLSSSREDWVLFPTLMYTYQHNAEQLNAGLSLQRNPLTLGVWYRHHFSNPDGFVLFTGLKHKKLKFGYSYDLLLSRLKNISGGAHEINITFLFNCRKKNQFEGTINCPEF